MEAPERLGKFNLRRRLRSALSVLIRGCYLSGKSFHLTLAQARPPWQPQCAARNHSDAGGEEQRDPGNRVAERAPEGPQNRDRSCATEDGDPGADREARAAVQRSEPQAVTALGWLE